MSAADSLCLRGSPANQNSFWLEAKQKQTTQGKKNNTQQKFSIINNSLVFFQDGGGE